MRKSAELIAENLREIRAEKGLSLLDLSMMTGLCANRLMRIESMCASDITIFELDAIAEALGLDTCELLRGA